jgi:hypothetical protein
MFFKPNAWSIVNSNPIFVKRKLDFVKRKKVFKKNKKEKAQQRKS